MAIEDFMCDSVRVFDFTTVKNELLEVENRYHPRELGVACSIQQVGASPDENGESRQQQKRFTVQFSSDPSLSRGSIMKIESWQGRTATANPEIGHFLEIESESTSGPPDCTMLWTYECTVTTNQGFLEYGV